MSLDKDSQLFAGPLTDLNFKMKVFRRRRVTVMESLLILHHL